MKLTAGFFSSAICCFVGTITVAQQNLFNVPSSDITEINRIFLQQQVNVFPKNITSNTTWCLGLGSNFEIGLNLSGVTYDYNKKRLVENNYNEQPLYPSYGINAQKMLVQYKKYGLSLGAQLLFHSKVSNGEWYGYLNNKLQLKNVKLIAGLYGGNNNYLGRETRFSTGIRSFGLQSGLEYQVIRDKLCFQADFISGHTAISNLIAGGAYNLNKHWILSAGYQIANNKASSSNGVIMELTFVQ